MALPIRGRQLRLTSLGDDGPANQDDVGNVQQFSDWCWIFTGTILLPPLSWEQWRNVGGTSGEQRKSEQKEHKDEQQQWNLGERGSSSNGRCARMEVRSREGNCEGVQCLHRSSAWSVCVSLLQLEASASSGRAGRCFWAFPGRFDPRSWTLS